MKKINKTKQRKKTDPAHPPIHPTGIEPKNFTDRENKIYDLIVRRTLATLADPAKRESVSAELDIKKNFHCKWNKNNRTRLA